MKRDFLILIFCLSNVFVFSQAERQHIRQGNDEYEQKQFENASVSYEKALEINPNSYEAKFNFGNALYEQNKYYETAKNLENLAATEKDSARLASIFHNLGNAYLQSVPKVMRDTSVSQDVIGRIVMRNLEKSISAYKKSLKINPSDKETKYNLQYAQKLLQRMKNQQQNQNKNKNQQQNQNQKSQDKQNQDKKDTQKQNQDQQNQENQGKNEQQQQKQQVQKGKISKQDAERLLQAIQHDELKVQEKLKKEKQQVRKSKTDKDW